MLINVYKSELMYLGENSVPTLSIVDEQEVAVTQAKGLWIVIDHTLTVSSKVDDAAINAYEMLTILYRTFERFIHETIIPAYSSLVRYYLYYCVQAFSPKLSKNIDTYEKL